MTTIAPPRPSLAARRVGYAVAIIVNAAVLYGVNVWPGWQVLPFLTDDTPQVLGVFNLSLAVGLAVNVVYLIHDPPWINALGGLATTAISLAVLARIWLVFPFDLRTASYDWEWLARFVLVLAIIGAGIGTIVQFFMLVGRLSAQSTPPTRTGRRA